MIKCPKAPLPLLTTFSRSEHHHHKPLSYFQTSSRADIWHGHSLDNHDWAKLRWRQGPNIFLWPKTFRTIRLSFDDGQALMNDCLWWKTTFEQPQQQQYQGYKLCFLQGGRGKNSCSALIGLISHKLTWWQTFKWFVNFSLSVTVKLKKR